MKTTEMSYKELQDKAAELSLDFGKPLNQVRKADLQKAIDEKIEDKLPVEPQSEDMTSDGNVKQLPTPTIKERIVQLGKEGLTKIDIQHTMEAEGYNIRYAYILVVLKQEGIEVPKAKRGRKPSPEKSEEQTTE